GRKLIDHPIHLRLRKNAVTDLATGTELARNLRWVVTVATRAHFPNSSLHHCWGGKWINGSSEPSNARIKPDLSVFFSNSRPLLGANITAAIAHHRRQRIPNFREQQLDSVRRMGCRRLRPEDAKRSAKTTVGERTLDRRNDFVTHGCDIERFKVAIPDE